MQRATTFFRVYSLGSNNIGVCDRSAPLPTGYAINHLGHDGVGMWHEEDGFFYDVLHMPDGRHVPLCVRSMAGLIPMYAVETARTASC